MTEVISMSNGGFDYVRAGPIDDAGEADGEPAYSDFRMKRVFSSDYS